jgi:membrane associated rhomboid family serine protease
MVAAMASTTDRKQRAGRVLLTIGGIALLLQVWTLWLETAAALNGASIASFGWVGTLGLATLQIVHFFAFHPNGVLLGLARVLLLCWPLAVMLFGIVFSRKAN